MMSVRHEMYIEELEEKIAKLEKVVETAEKYIKMCIGAKGSQDEFYEALAELGESE